MLPFDVMSRTLMIATANPFDALGKQAVHQLLDYNIQWHLASPTAIFNVLTEAYKVGGSRSIRPANGAAPFAPAAPSSAPHIAPAATTPPLAVAPPSAPPPPVDEPPAAPLPDTSAFRLSPK